VVRTSNKGQGSGHRTTCFRDNNKKRLGGRALDTRRRQVKGVYGKQSYKGSDRIEWERHKKRKKEGNDVHVDKETEVTRWGQVWRGYKHGAAHEEKTVLREV